MTEFECGTWCPGILEVVWGWQKWVLESRMGWKLISMSLWALQDVTPPKSDRLRIAHTGFTLAFD